MASIGETVIVPEDEKIKRDIVSIVDRQLGPIAEAVILYGSRARGDARADSDWDVLVMVSDVIDPAHARRILSSAFMDLLERKGADVSPCVLRWSEADENAGLLRNALEEGIPLA